MPPVINEEKCIKCGTCVDICSEDVFFGSKKKEYPQVTYPEMCLYCNCCVNDCPSEGAIRLRIPANLLLAYKHS